MSISIISIVLFLFIIIIICKSGLWVPKASPFGNLQAASELYTYSLSLYIYIYICIYIYIYTIVTIHVYIYINIHMYTLHLLYTSLRSELRLGSAPVGADCLKSIHAAVCSADSTSLCEGGV